MATTVAAAVVLSWCFFLDLRRASADGGGSCSLWPDSGRQPRGPGPGGGLVAWEGFQMCRLASVAALRGGGKRAKMRKQALKDRSRKMRMIRTKILTRIRARRGRLPLRKKPDPFAGVDVDELGTSYANQNKGKHNPFHVTVFKGANKEYEKEAYERETRSRKTGRHKRRRKLPI